MAYRKNPTVFKINTDKFGVPTADEVLDIIQDNVEQSSEFYEIEPAIVKEVFIDPATFPKEDGPNGSKIPNYEYLGTIRATFAYSQDGGSEIEEIIRPLTTHITAYPLKGEVVNVCMHGGRYYYYHPLNLHGKVNMNRVAGELGEGLVLLGRTNLNRTIYPDQGDVVINGRFGHGIKLGSDAVDYKYPSIKITNGQSIATPKTDVELYPHVQNINADGSSIHITSGPHQNDALIPAATSKYYPPEMDGDMITINSDKLVFNAKGDPNEKGNNGDIHMMAVRNINLSSNYSITLEPGKNGVINLGDPWSINSVVKGNELEDLFFNLFEVLDKFSNTLTGVSGIAEINDAAKSLKKSIKKIGSELLPAIHSKTVFITNDKEEDLSTGTEVLPESVGPDYA